MIFSFMKVKDRLNNADLDIETGGRKSRVWGCKRRERRDGPRVSSSGWPSRTLHVTQLVSSSNESLHFSGDPPVRGGWQKMLRITAKLGPHSIAQEGDRQDVLIALFIFGSKTQITLGGGAVSEAQMALSFYLNRIEWQNKVFFNLNNVWNASPAIEGSIREFWLDAEIKIGKELNYLGTIILMICPQSLIAFIQLDRAMCYKLAL